MVNTNGTSQRVKPVLTWPVEKCKISLAITTAARIKNRNG